MKNLLLFTFHKKTTTTSISFLFIIILLAAIIPALSPHADDLNGAVHLEKNNQGPSCDHWFGTDAAGRDMFILTIRGALVSIPAAIGLSLILI